MRFKEYPQWRYHVRKPKGRAVGFNGHWKPTACNTREDAWERAQTMLRGGCGQVHINVYVEIPNPLKWRKDKWVNISSRTIGVSVEFDSWADGVSEDVDRWMVKRNEIERI